MTAALPPLTVRIDSYPGGVRHVAFTGYLDLHTGQHLGAAISLIPPGRAVILNLNGITFADCAGYRALMIAARDLAARGTIYITGMPPAIQRIAALIVE